MSVIQDSQGNAFDLSNPVPTQLTGSNVVNGGQVKGTLYGSIGQELLVSSANTAGDNGSLGYAIETLSVGYKYNGSGYDRDRNNTQGTLLASAARTVTATSPIQTNYNARGVVVTLYVTAASGTGGLQVQIYGDGPSGETLGYMAPSPTAPITATGRYMFIVYPGTTTGAMTSGNLTWSVNAPLVRSWHVTVAHSDASSYTYVVDYGLIL